MGISNKLTKDLQDAMGDEAIGTTKYKKEESESHSNNRGIERAAEKAKPRLTVDMLRNQRVQILPDPINPDPNYRYKWGSLDQVGANELLDDINYRNYSYVTQEEMPELAMYMKHGNTTVTGVPQNCIRIKEMILLKVHKEDWEVIMTENHHNAPAAGEREIKSGFYEKLGLGGGAVTKMSKEASTSPFAEDSEDHIAQNADGENYAVQTGINNSFRKVKPIFR